MGATKTHSYSDEQNRLAGLLRALAHPARLAILELLLEEDCCNCRDLTEEIDLAQPTISRHLSELRAAGLIRGTHTGTRVRYCIDPARWRATQKELNELFDRFRDGPDAPAC